MRTQYNELKNANTQFAFWVKLTTRQAGHTRRCSKCLKLAAMVVSEWTTIESSTTCTMLGFCWHACGVLKNMRHDLVVHVRRVHNTMVTSTSFLLQKRGRRKARLTTSFADVVRLTRGDIIWKKVMATASMLLGRSVSLLTPRISVLCFGADFPALTTRDATSTTETNTQSCGFFKSLHTLSGDVFLTPESRTRRSGVGLWVPKIGMCWRSSVGWV